jgi:hypothetical protein
MDVTRNTKPREPSENQGGPFRTLYVESEEVNIRYKLTEYEVQEAVIEWLENSHGIKAAGGELVFVVPENPQGGGNMVRGILDRYNLAIDVENS